METNLVSFNIELVCIQSRGQTNEQFNFVKNYDKLPILFKMIQEQYLDNTSEKRVEGLAILLKGLAQAKGKHGDFCASVLRAKLEEIALIYPDSMKRCVQKEEFSKNDNLRSIIDTINYLVRPKFFNGYSPFGTRFSKHLGDRFGAEDALRAPTILVGLALLLNGSQLVSPTQKDTEPSEAGLSIGSSLITIGTAFVSANIIGPWLKVRKEKPVNEEIFPSSQDPVSHDISVMTPKDSPHSQSETTPTHSNPRLIRVISSDEVSRASSTDRLVSESPWLPIDQASRQENSF